MIPMGQITEERRKELEGKSKEELAVLIRAHRKNLSEASVDSRADALKSALRECNFVVLSDPSKTLADMAKALNHTIKTIGTLRTSLLSIDAIERRTRGLISDEKVYSSVLKLGPSTCEEIAKTLHVKTPVIVGHVQRLKSEDKVRVFKISMTFLVVANNTQKKRSSSDIQTF